MKNETFGVIKTSPTESFNNLKEKLFPINSNVTSNQVSSWIEKDEEEIEELEEDENIKTASIKNISQNIEKKSFENEEDEIHSLSSTDNHKIKIYSKSEIKEKILNIFRDFSSYSKEEKRFFISQQTLIKIFKKINLIERNGLKLNELDLILRKVNPNPHSNKFTEKQFLNLVIRLSEKLNPDLFKNDPKLCVSSFFFQNLENLFQESHIVKEKDTFESDFLKQNFSSYKIIESIVKQSISDELIKILNSIYTSIKEIYVKYFEFEIDSKIEIKKLREESFNSLCEFSKDFEILPYVINLNQLVNYYNSITLSNFSNFIFLSESKKEMGSFYTLSKFFLSFIHFSQIFYLKTSKNIQPNSKVSDIDKLLIFLEKLENSEGLLTFERKINRPHSACLSLIPTNYFLNQFDDQLNKDSNYDKTKHSKKAFNEKGHRNLRNSLSVSDETLTLVNSKMDFLKEIFIHYCKFGDKLTHTKMNFSSLLKFLRDCKAIAELPEEIKNNIKKEKDYAKRFIYLKRKKNTLTSSEVKKSYTKLLTKILNVDGVVGKLSESDVDIIYSKLTGTSNKEINSDFNKIFYNSEISSKFEENVLKGLVKVKTYNDTKNKSHLGGKLIDFNLFLKSFELIAVRLFPNIKLDLAVSKFFDEHLDRFVLNNFNISDERKVKSDTQHEIGSKQEMLNLLKELKPIFLHLYNGYSDLHRFMNFSLFNEFYKDFNIFPDLINILQLKSLFYSLSCKFNKQNENLNPQDLIDLKKNNFKIISKKSESDIVINFSYFLESISNIAGFMLLDEDINDEEKILYLLERMNKSKGLDKLQKKFGTTVTSSKDFHLFLSKLKEKYQGFNKYNKNQEQSLQNSDLFSKIFD